MRIILALIGTWVLMASNMLSDDNVMIAGFVLGVFPLVIWQIIQSVFKKVAGVTLQSMRSELPVSDLDGLTVWHENRLEEEDIENLPNMATADLVELLLNTRIPRERIIDWTDQAILYTQLGARSNTEQRGPREKLREHGIRTATSLLHAAARSTDPAAFNRILESADGVPVMPTLIASLATNCNLQLVQRWRDMQVDDLRTTVAGAPAG
jgi:hypothetical protein